MKKYSNLRCPTCHREIIKLNNSLECTACKKSFVLENEIVKFTEEEFFWSVFDKKTASQIIDVAKKESWIAAINKYKNKIGAYTYSYITETSRADFQIYLPITKESIVLDIGSGWGNVAVALSSKCKRYYCADVNLFNLELLNSRLQNNKISNADLLLYDANSFLKLPFADNSVDVVLLNGVLEWMGNIEHSDNPRKIQLENLREIRRVLKKTGTLYIGIENRFALQHFKGAKPHGELPFIGLLPRILSNLITKLIRKKEHRTYIYSFWGYKKLLNEAGFIKQEFYWPRPSYHFTNVMIPLNHKNNIKYWAKYLVSSNSKIKNFLLKNGISNLPIYLFAHSYCIIAEVD